MKTLSLRTLLILTFAFVMQLNIAPQAIAQNQDQESREAEALAKFEKVQADFDESLESLREAVEAAESNEEKARIFIKGNPSRAYTDSMLELAGTYTDTKVGAKAALAALVRLKNAARAPAMELLIREYPDRVAFAKMARSFLEEIPSPEAESWMREMREHATNDKTKVAVTMTLCEYINRMGRYQNSLEDNPVLYDRLPAAQLDYINAERTAESYAELGEMLDWVSETSTRDASAAKSLKTELTQLRVGQVAPDAIGKDLDGNEVRLSDYRGKVVMFRFWGHWCPPCRAMFDHEQHLAQQLKNEPFVLLGVNSDRKLETARQAVRDEGLTWRHIWNGARGTKGGIAETWNVQDWPTIYLIDAKGVIRAKNISYANLDRAIEDVLAGMDREVLIEYQHDSP